jgi:AGZA family xanthine/uracil permease-like MFS transporter
LKKTFFFGIELVVLIIQVGARLCKQLNQKQQTCTTTMPLFDGLNNAVQNSFVGRYFEMEDRKTNFTTEFRGATATFLTMAYIIAVNPRILADSGGPCVPCSEDEGGIFCDDYGACMESIKREFVTSTAIASMVGCMLMGLMANLPIALAPGMGKLSMI